VKAPGTANSATFLPENTSEVDSGFGPSALKTLKVASGSLSPTLMLIFLVSSINFAAP
jgi:hypothetical protein